MNDHNALISPSFFFDTKELSDFLREFGPYEGRYVYQYPGNGNWKRLLQDYVYKDLKPTPVESLKIKELIRKLDSALLNKQYKCEYKDESLWEDNVKKCDEFKTVPLIVGSAIDPHEFKTWSDCLDEIRNTTRRSWRIKGSLNDYLEAIKPLACISSLCCLIDRYLDPLSENGEAILQGVLNVIAHGGTHCYEIHLITSEEKFALNESNKRKLCELYADKVKDRKLIIHTIKEDKLGGECLRMHNRYFLTEKGAIDFGVGYSIIKQKHEQIDVYIVDKSSHDNLKSIYINGIVRRKDQLPPPSKIKPKEAETFEVVKGQEICLRKIEQAVKWKTYYR